jgi:hypothetical protein
MRTGAAGKTRSKTVSGRRKQVNLRVEPALYQALEAVARQDRRSVPQAARRLLEEGLQHHAGGQVSTDDTAAHEIGVLAARGGAFDWLAEEPDLYDDTCGEPL